MKPARKVRAQRKFAQGAHIPTVNSATAVNEKKLAELPKNNNKTIIRNHVPASVLLDIVSFKSIHHHPQPIVLLERLNTNTKKITKPTKKLLPHVWNMTLRSRSVSKGRSKSSEKRRSASKRKSSSRLEAQVKRRQIISKDFTSDDNKPLTHFLKKTAQTNIQSKTQSGKKRKYKKRGPRKNSHPSNIKIVSVVSCQNAGNNFTPLPAAGPGTPDDSPSPLIDAVSDASNFYYEYDFKEEKITIDEPQPGPSGIQAQHEEIELEMDNREIFSPDSESMSDLAIPTILASSALMDSSSSSSSVEDSDGEVDPPLIYDPSPVMDTSATRSPNTENILQEHDNTSPLVRDSPERLIEVSTPVIMEPTVVAPPSASPIPSGGSNAVTNDLILPTPAVESSSLVGKFGTKNKTTQSPSEYEVIVVSSGFPHQMQQTELQKYLKKVLPAPYYNDVAIQNWIKYSEITSKDNVTHCLDEPSVDEPVHSGTQTLEPSECCPARDWSTLKDIMNALTCDFEARCKKCETCLKIEKLLLLSTLLKKHRRIECTGGRETSLDTELQDEVASLDDYSCLELLPAHPHFLIRIKLWMHHKRYVLGARLIPRADVRHNDKLNLVEKEALAKLLIKILMHSLESQSRKLDSLDDAVSVTVKEEGSVVDLTMCESKGSDHSESASDAGSHQSQFPKCIDRAKLVDGPVFYPTQEEFTDPIAYFEKIAPVASQYGLCKVIPPPSHRFTPKCKIDDDIRFDVINQYISRLYNRWGPAARELCAIKACLKSQSLNLTRSPLLDGIEVNLAKLYHVVQRNGGLEKVIDKKRWGRVAEEMSFTKTPNPERKLDNIYMKYLLPYDTLAHKERQEIIRKVERHWNIRNQKMLDRALNPLHRQKRLLGVSESSDEDTGDESDVGNALAEAEDCIVQGSCMNLSKFKKIAAIALENNFRTSTAPSPEAVEELYWRLVLLGTEHICVNTASIDTGEEGYGFSKNSQDPYSSHPWNLKMLSQNSHNVLRSLGPVLGVTAPSLHLGMVFSTSCWHSDPHGLPWIEYMHQGSTKIWYGIPKEQSQNFRKAVETLCPTSCQNKSIWLPSDITMIPPTLLLEHNVSLSKVVQNPGEFILVYPEAYSCSISTGYTLTESVYFATQSWLRKVHLVFQELRESCEPTMFSIEQLLLSVVQDPRASPSVLQLARDRLSIIIADELVRRYALNSMKLQFIHDKSREQDNKKKRTTSTWNVRDYDECEVCRMTLYLSKVSGLTGKKSSVCLQHALMLLNPRKSTDLDRSTVQVTVYFSQNELERVMNQMERRLATPVPGCSSQDD